MCYVKPLKVKIVNGNKVTMDNGIKAYCEKKIGILKPNDMVLVYGNIVLEKISKKRYEQTK